MIKTVYIHKSSMCRKGERKDRAGENAIRGGYFFGPERIIWKQSRRALHPESPLSSGKTRSDLGQQRLALTMPVETQGNSTPLNKKVVRKSWNSKKTFKKFFKTNGNEDKAKASIKLAIY